MQRGRAGGCACTSDMISRVWRIGLASEPDDRGPGYVLAGAGSTLAWRKIYPESIHPPILGLGPDPSSSALAWHKTGLASELNCVPNTEPVAPRSLACSTCSLAPYSGHSARAALRLVSSLSVQAARQLGCALCAHYHPNTSPKHACMRGIRRYLHPHCSEALQTASPSLQIAARRAYKSSAER